MNEEFINTMTNKAYEIYMTIRFDHYDINKNIRRIYDNRKHIFYEYENKKCVRYYHYYIYLGINE